METLSELFNVIGVACLTNLAIVSEPAQLVKGVLCIPDSSWYGRLLNCGLCLSFWTGLCYGVYAYGFTLDALIAAGLTSVAGEMINRKLLS